MWTFIKAVARYTKCVVVEKLTEQTNVIAMRAWHSALKREQHVRDILGAERHESTQEAAWRVAGDRR